MKYECNTPAFSTESRPHKKKEKGKLLLSLSITLVVMVAEFVGGLLTQSMALVGDAGHMLTHAVAIGLGLLALYIASQPACHHRTFGLYRAEIVAAFVNGLFLLAVTALIAYHAIERLLNPQPVLAGHMLWIALLGLAVNVASIFILHGSHKHDLNIKSVFFHLFADAVSSVAVVVAAVVMHFTSWTFIDPIITLGITLIILYWAHGILRDSGKILLEMTPKGMDVEAMGEELKEQFQEIEALHNVHLWSITSEMFIFTAHLKLKPASDPAAQKDALLPRVDQYLKKKYHIIETTLQVE